MCSPKTTTKRAPVEQIDDSNGRCVRVRRGPRVVSVRFKKLKSHDGPPNWPAAAAGVVGAAASALPGCGTATPLASALRSSSPHLPMSSSHHLQHQWPHAGHVYPGQKGKSTRAHGRMLSVAATNNKACINRKCPSLLLPVNVYRTRSAASK